ncbi:unnamed protein product, partial [Timema podura]|nr:unnamed protein product [Timema podura]
MVSKLGTEKTMTLPRESRDKILVSGANLLMEGSLDTRCYAKQLFRQLSSYPNFSRIITEVVPAPVLRNISKTLQNLK